MNVAALVALRAEVAPDAVALVMGATRLTFADLWDQSARYAALMTEYGVEPGDRVMMYSDNCPEFFSIYLAAARLGAIFSPVHHAYQRRELEYVLRNSQAAIMFVQVELHHDICQRHDLESMLPGVVVLLGDGASPVEGMDDARTAGVGPVADVEPDAPVLIAYTSGGSSASLTPVTRSHAGERWNARTYAEVWDIRDTDRVLVPLPLSWVYGLSTVGLSALSAGATLVLQPARRSDPLLPAIARHQITLFAGTMTMYSRMLAELQTQEYSHVSLRRLYIGGEPVVLPIIKLVEHYTGIRPLQAYATTEVAPVLAVDPSCEVTAPEGTVGRLLGGSEIRLIDQAGLEVQDGQVGEAWLRGRGAMLGYWQEPAATAARLTEDGWYRSGDLLWRDDEGYYFMAGRHDDIIIREGAKVALVEVEASIADLYGVEDVVVLAVPDEDFGEAAIAFVVVAGRRVSIDTIYDELGARIARFKLPREIYILAEFPLGFTGKRDRNRLRGLVGDLKAPGGVVVTMAEWVQRRSGDLGRQG